MRLLASLPHGSARKTRPRALWGKVQTSPFRGEVQGGSWTARPAQRQDPSLAAPQHVAYIARHDLDQRHPARLPRFFRPRGARDRALGAAGAAERPDPDVRQRRHGAVQERLHRPRDAALCHRRLVAEMRARRRQAQRSRQCRLYRAPPHLLRDARQFLVRRLFQGAGDQPRLGPADQGMGPVPRPADRHRLSHRRRGLGPVEEDRRPARRAHHPHPDQGQFLGDGRQRPVRALLGDLLRPWRPHPRRAARQPGRGRRPLHRDLEPRLHAVRAGGQ